jgi:hypothetical protein
VESFQEELRRLETNQEQVLRECEEFREKVLDWFSQRVEEAEQGIHGTSDVNLRLMGTTEFRPVVKLAAYSIAIWDLERQERPKVEVDGELAEALGAFLWNDELFDIPAGRYSPELDTGILGDRECKVSVFVLPEKIREDINFEECPGILKPLFRKIISNDNGGHHVSQMERFHALINHEMTHAYISGKLGHDWRSDYKVQYNFKIDREHELDIRVKSIDEGACQAVSSIVHPGKSTYVEGYQDERRHTMADLQFFKTCFMIYARRFDSKEEKVSAIRKRAVETVERIYKTQKRKSGMFDYTKLPFINEYTVVEAVLGENDMGLVRFRAVLKMMEEVEQESFFSLALLNMLEYDRDNHMYSFISEIESESDNTIEQFVSSEGAITELIPEEGQKKRYYPDRGEYGETEIEHEFDDSLYEIRQGLQRLLAVAEKNENLSQEERERIKSAVEDVKEAIEIYKEENKLEQSMESELEEEYREDTQKIARWIKQRVEKGEYTDPVRVLSDLKVETEAVVDDYRKMIHAGIEYNQKIEQRLEALHHEEEGIHRILDERNVNDEEVQEMMDITRHVYNLCQKSTTKLRDAEDKLDQATEILEEL